MKSSLKTTLAGFATALWWGSLMSLGAWVVPTLFARIPDKTLAGNVAGRLFSLQNYVALACAWLVLLACANRGLVEQSDGSLSRQKMGRQKQHTMALVAVAASAALLIEYLAAPHIMARDNLAFWHPFASGLLLLEWLLVTVLLWRQLTGTAWRN